MAPPNRTRVPACTGAASTATAVPAATTATGPERSTTGGELSDARPGHGVRPGVAYRLALVPSDAAVRGLGASRLRLRAGSLASLRPKWSTAAAIRAARATVVMPGMFAIADKLIGNLQVALFAAFGSFATLVLASFGGSRRDKLTAHVLLALSGSVLLTIGTAVHSVAALAAIVTVPVAFVVFFSGVCGPNAASGGFAALLAYVLPAASPGTFSMVPDRLAGWWLASVAGTAAVLLFSPRSEGDRLRAAASNLATELADELDAALNGVATPDRLHAAIAAKGELLTVFTSTPYRPTGLATADQALANTVELLEWCTSLLADTVSERDDLRDAPVAERAPLEASSTTLREVASLLAGGDAQPDLDELERLRAQSSAHLGELAPGGDRFEASVQLAFHAQTIAVAVRSLAGDVLVASGRADAETIATRSRYWYGASATRGVHERRLPSVVSAANVALRHASVRSVWFVNSARAALAMAAAIAVADVTNVQHGFWVVLGTLSVLRTSAGATGATALRALAGTALGFVVGGALLLAIGTSTTALWIALPIAVFVASYAPGTLPFVVGQAAFTVVVAVLFNLLVPVGWKVGVVRIEDVALGCAVSVVVGILFWPRGASGVVGNDLADTFRRGAAYLGQGVDWAIGSRTREPDGMAAVTTAALRLDDALRGFLAEQGSKRIRKPELWHLVGGALRLRLTANALAGLPQGVADDPETAPALAERAQQLEAWYGGLAAHVGRPRRRPGGSRGDGGSWPAVFPVSAPGDIDGTSYSARACYTIWVQELLHHLTGHLSELRAAAEHVAEVRRRPWWR